MGAFLLDSSLAAVDRSRRRHGAQGMAALSPWPIDRFQQQPTTRRRSGARAGLPIADRQLFRVAERRLAASIGIG